MNKAAPLLIIRFIILVLFQVLIGNHINFMGTINPYIYILFIIYFPVQNNRMLFLVISFFLGLCIDWFSDSGGIHAAAALTAAYIRPILLKSTFGTLYKNHNLKLNITELSSKITYISLLTLTHHFVLFNLEIFSISRTIFVLEKTLFSSIFTIFLCVILSIIFSRNSK